MSENQTKKEAFVSFRKVWTHTKMLGIGLGISDEPDPWYRRYCIVVSVGSRCLIIGWHYPKG